MSDNCAAVTVSDHIQCGICLDTWRHPVEVLPCRHIFCTQCISGVSPCPMCRGAITSTQPPSRLVTFLSDGVRVECSECQWQGTREQSYTHSCSEVHARPPRSPATPVHIDATALALLFPDQAADANTLVPAHDASQEPELVSAETIVSRTVDFSDQQEREDLSELASQQDTLRVIAKNCVILTEIVTLVVCEYLMEVNFAGCANLCDTTPLRGLVWLRAVNLSATAVSDISFAAFCPALEQAYFSGLKRLFDLSPLLECRNLKELWVLNTSVADLSALRGMPWLETLAASGCAHLADLSPLQECKRLRELWVSNTSVSELTALRGRACLEKFAAGCCTRLHDLSPLCECLKLRELWVQNTSVADLSALRRMGCLEIFSATSCASLHDLLPLRQCGKLKEVYVGNTPIADLTALCGMASLETIWASNSQVRHADGLDTCPMLTTLRLDDTP